MRPYRTGALLLTVALALGVLSACSADEEPPVESAFQSLKKLVAADAADYDTFGIAVALGAEFAIVGSPGDDDEGSNAGAAYIFARTEGGTDGWGEVVRLVAADAAAGDLFGISVDISGDTAAVGAASEDGAGADRGAVYIFYRNQGGTDAWGQVARLRASGAADGDDFGISVALDGDTLIVGAEGYAGATDQEGAAYIFRRDQGGANAWGQVVRLLSDEPGDTDQYGYSVDIGGDIALVGAPGEDTVGGNRGAVRVYARDLGGADAWGLVKKIAPSDPQDNSWFGTSVAVRGTRAVVSAPWHDGAGTDRGAVYVFGRDEGGADAWGQVAVLTASDARDDDLFGLDVALYGSHVVASAPYSRGGGTERGQVYAFGENEGGPGAWGEVQILRASDGSNSDQFGVAVDAFGGYILGGATGEDGSGTDRGAAYLFKEI
ncbi:MAG: FG-GAP repeat protein [Candidatus Aminicenantes bacterium]|nr:FG-GAP repeat protein [Candidatus Aminicenantes bacterium]NLH77754.1 hypothetical protein [Acidobacteriota bacterium]